MAWTLDWSTVADADADWASVANVQDFQKAVNERSNALGNGDAIAPLKTVGDDVQDHAWIEEIQDWVEAQLGNFVVLRAAGFYDGTATNPSTDTYANLAALFADAGLGTATWRAYTTHPDDGGVDQGRQIQPDDIIGPWLFEDIQAVLNRLVLTVETVAWTADSENNDKESQNTDAATDTWAQAKAAAEADWAADPTLSSANAAPGGLTRGYIKAALGTFAYERRRYAYGQATVDDSRLRTVEWYGYINRPTSAFYGGPSTAEWAAYGDGYTEDKWTLWQTDTPDPASATEMSSSALGHISSKPTDDGTWCSQPGEAEDVQKGWEATDVIAVIRWNIAGGFSYT